MTDTINWKNNAHGHQFIASFSGGKDGSLALYKTMKVGKAIGLIVMMKKEGKRAFLPLEPN